MSFGFTCLAGLYARRVGSDRILAQKVAEEIKAAQSEITDLEVAATRSGQGVARELTRVCAPGGTIALANWTAGGFVGKMFNTITKFIAPSGMPSPLLWGNEAVVRERFGSQVCELRLARRHYTFDCPFSPSDVV